MSVDPAHSLADSLDLETTLFDGQTGDPFRIDDNPAIHEVNIQKEIKRHWREISSYVISVLRTTGIGEVEAEELAILPGMEELSAKDGGPSRQGGTDAFVCQLNRPPGPTWRREKIGDFAKSSRQADLILILSTQYR
jgi:hypothetical protein